MKLILASSSIGRKKLLTALKVLFEIVPSNIDEDKINHTSPKQTIHLRAQAKAKQVAEKFRGQNALILAADSMVILRGQTMGKPKNKKEAISMLKKLSGATHQFTTAFYIVNTKTGKTYCGDETSTITFKKMTNEEIRFYASLDNLTCYAGGYSIYDSPQWFIKEVKGSISNVVGLPLEKVIPILKLERLLYIRRLPKNGLFKVGVRGG
jgi:septum formation protein